MLLAPWGPDQCTRRWSGFFFEGLIMSYPQSILRSAIADTKRRLQNRQERLIELNSNVMDVKVDIKMEEERLILLEQAIEKLNETNMD